MPVEKSDDISKKTTVEMWLVENKENTYFSPILKSLLAKSQNLARRKKGCWNSPEQTGTGGLFLPIL
jgi:hypothetical protein